MRKIALYVGIPLFVLFLGTLYLGMQPNRDLNFSRDVPSTASQARLGAALDDLREWPKWHYSLSAATILGPDGAPAADQTLFEGANLLLKVDPGKGPWKRVELKTRVTAYKPGDFVRLEILGDSKGKINQLLSGLQWQVNILPAPDAADGKSSRYKSVIRGTAHARTAGFRARVFGALTEKIVMTQVFYPDLISYAELDSPDKSAKAGIPGL